MHKIYNTTITAHAGALGTEPNTMESVKAMLAFIGGGIIEVDVRFLPDGIPALGHNWVGPESPTLEDVFALLRDGSAHVNIDMKEFTHLARVAELVDAYGLRGRAFLTGIGEADCAAARECGLPHYLNSTDPAAAKRFGTLGVNMQFRKCTAQLVKAAHAQGLLVSIWTADSVRVMRKMLRLGVDNITTRRPDKLREIINHAS